ncbi:MAG TPA: helix-turn-helix transcriptional regulator [Chloroflexota bacterium]
MEGLFVTPAAGGANGATQSEQKAEPAMPRRRRRRPTSTRFGPNLTELRTRAGWSQDELGRLLDIERAVISKWERGLGESSFEELQRIAALFKVTTDQLLGDLNASPSAIPGDVWTSFLRDFLTHYPGRVEVNFWAPHQVSNVASGLSPKGNIA